MLAEARTGIAGKNIVEGLLQRKTETPMKIFLYYGHTEDTICTRIRDVLTKRGHEVWFDKTHINTGSDWREEITKGILGSEGVLSMLSRHSVRNPGVCLDEMSIAIGVKGGNICYVLLENYRMDDEWWDDKRMMYKWRGTCINCGHKDYR